MGIDYVPFAIVDSKDLDTLCRLHTKSFQSIPFYWSRSEGLPNTIDKHLCRVHSDTCLATGKQIQSKISLFWDETRRIAFIDRNPRLPPSIRFQALGTFLPNEVPSLRSRWKRWLEEADKQEAYQKELFIHNNIPRLRCAVEELHYVARAKSSKLDSFVLDVFMLSPDVNRFTVMHIDAIAWFTTKHAETIDQRLDKYLTYYHKVRKMQRRVRRCLSGKWKSEIQVLPKEPFEQFKDFDMGDFMEWLDKQIDAGRGLYLSF